MRRKKILPLCTTLHACDSFPTNDKSIRFLQCLMSSQCLIVRVNSASFSSGSLISPLRVSRMIPRNGITGVGPSIFSIFSGSPRKLQVAIIICKLLAHCDVLLHLLSKSHLCNANTMSLLALALSTLPYLLSL